MVDVEKVPDGCSAWASFDWVERSVGTTRRRRSSATPGRPCGPRSQDLGSGEGSTEKKGNRVIEKGSVRSLRRSLSRTYWLIAKDGDDRPGGGCRYRTARRRESAAGHGLRGGSRAVSPARRVRQRLAGQEDRSRRAGLGALGALRVHRARGPRSFTGDQGRGEGDQPPRELEPETLLGPPQGRESAQPLEPDLSVVEPPEEARDGR